MSDTFTLAHRRELKQTEDLLHDAASLSPAMRRMARQLKLAARTEATVFIVGESGSGKELAARAIHAHSPRRDARFVPIHCGAIGSGRSRSLGCFERASGGTLFLDEVTEMPLDMQVQFLRVLETCAYRRVGGNELSRPNARVICASNRDPLLAVEEGRLRQDFLHRLLVIPLRIPPLRERDDDARTLALRFLARLNDEHHVEKTFSARMLDAIGKYDWPGNVRELHNVIQRAHALSNETLDVELPVRARQPQRPVQKDGRLSFRVGTTLEDAQREFILATLEQYSHDKRRTADVLGVSLKTLYNRLDRYAGPE